MRAWLVLFAAFLSVPLIGVLDSTPQAQDSTELRAPSAFAGISEPQARSRALGPPPDDWNPPQKTAPRTFCSKKTA